MRVRIVTTVAILAGSLGVATTVAGPVYTAFGGEQATTSTADNDAVLAGRSNALNGRSNALGHPRPLPTLLH